MPDATNLFADIYSKYIEEKKKSGPTGKPSVLERDLKDLASSPDAKKVTPQAASTPISEPSPVAEQRRPAPLTPPPTLAEKSPLAPPPSAPKKPFVYRIPEPIINDAISIIVNLGTKKTEATRIVRAAANALPPTATWQDLVRASFSFAKTGIAKQAQPETVPEPAVVGNNEPDEPQPPPPAPKQSAPSPQPVDNPPPPPPPPPQATAEAPPRQDTAPPAEPARPADTQTIPKAPLTAPSRKNSSLLGKIAGGIGRGMTKAIHAGIYAETGFNTEALHNAIKKPKGTPTTPRSRAAGVIATVAGARSAGVKGDSVVQAINASTKSIVDSIADLSKTTKESFASLSSVVAGLDDKTKKSNETLEEISNSIDEEKYGKLEKEGAVSDKNALPNALKEKEKEEKAGGGLFSGGIFEDIVEMLGLKNLAGSIKGVIGGAVLLAGKFAAGAAAAAAFGTAVYEAEKVLHGAFDKIFNFITGKGDTKVPTTPEEAADLEKKKAGEEDQLKSKQSDAITSYLPDFLTGAGRLKEKIKDDNEKLDAYKKEHAEAVSPATGEAPESSEPAQEAPQTHTATTAPASPAATPTETLVAPRVQTDPMKLQEGDVEQPAKRIPLLSNMGDWLLSDKDKKAAAPADEPTTIQTSHEEKHIKGNLGIGPEEAAKKFHAVVQESYPETAAPASKPETATKAPKESEGFLSHIWHELGMGSAGAAELEGPRGIPQNSLANSQNYDNMTDDDDRISHGNAEDFSIYKRYHAISNHLDGGGDLNYPQKSDNHDLDLDAKTTTPNKEPGQIETVGLWNNIIKNSPKVLPWIKKLLPGETKNDSAPPLDTEPTIDNPNLTPPSRGTIDVPSLHERDVLSKMDTRQKKQKSINDESAQKINTIQPEANPLDWLKTIRPLIPFISGETNGRSGITNNGDMRNFMEAIGNSSGSGGGQTKNRTGTPASQPGNLDGFNLAPKEKEITNGRNTISNNDNLALSGGNRGNDRSSTKTNYTTPTNILGTSRNEGEIKPTFAKGDSSQLIPDMQILTEAKELKLPPPPTQGRQQPGISGSGGRPRPRSDQTEMPSYQEFAAGTKQIREGLESHNPLWGPDAAANFHKGTIGHNPIIAPFSGAYNALSNSPIYQLYDDLRKARGLGTDPKGIITSPKTEKNNGSSFQSVVDGVDPILPSNMQHQDYQTNPKSQNVSSAPSISDSQILSEAKELKLAPPPSPRAQHEPEWTAIHELYLSKKGASPRGKPETATPGKEQAIGGGGGGTTTTASFAKEYFDVPEKLIPWTEQAVADATAGSAPGWPGKAAGGLGGESGIGHQGRFGTAPAGSGGRNTAPHTEGEAPTSSSPREGAPAGAKAQPTEGVARGGGGGRNGSELRNTRMRESYDFWRSQGYSHYAAMANIGSEAQESGGNPNAKGDSGKAGGLFQWHQDRRDAILKGTGIDVYNASRADQLKAAAWEQSEKGPENQAGKNIREATNQEEAFKAGAGFERFKDYNKPNSPNYQREHGLRTDTMNRYDQPFQKSAAETNIKPEGTTESITPSMSKDELNKANLTRPSRYEGKFSIPGADGKLQEFNYASGGAGRQSSPFGVHPISEFLSAEERQRRGMKDMSRGGIRSGDTFQTPPTNDPKYPGNPRLGVDIHSGSTSDIHKIMTEGCFGIPKDQWPAAEKAIKERVSALGGHAVMNVDPTTHQITIDAPGTTSTQPLTSFVDQHKGTGESEPSPTPTGLNKDQQNSIISPEGAVAAAVTGPSAAPQGDDHGPMKMPAGLSFAAPQDDDHGPMKMPAGLSFAAPQSNITSAIDAAQDAVQDAVQDSPPGTSPQDGATPSLAAQDQAQDKTQDETEDSKIEPSQLTPGVDNSQRFASNDPSMEQGSNIAPQASAVPALSGSGGEALSEASQERESDKMANQGAVTINNNNQQAPSPADRGRDPNSTKPSESDVNATQSFSAYYYA